MVDTAKSPPQASPGIVSPQMVKVYVVALVLVVLAELIGFVRWTPIEKITILLVPFVNTIWLAVLFAPQASGRWVRVYTLSDSAWAAGIILTATYPLMARYGTLVGPNVPKLLQAGVALILQEAGNNWGAIVIAMPIAILLGLRREVIGAFAAFFLVFYPYYYRWLVGRIMSKIVNARPNPKALAARTLRATPEGLELAGAGSKTTKSWDRISGIEVTADRTFVAIDGEYTIVLPRLRLGDEPFQKMIDTIRRFAKLSS